MASSKEIEAKSMEIVTKWKGKGWLSNAHRGQGRGFQRHEYWVFGRSSRNARIPNKWVFDF